MLEWRRGKHVCSLHVHWLRIVQQQIVGPSWSRNIFLLCKHTWTVSYASVEVVMKMTQDRPKQGIDCLPSVQKRVAKDKLNQKSFFSHLSWGDDFRNHWRQFLRTKSSLGGFMAPIYHNPFVSKILDLDDRFFFGEGSRSGFLSNQPEK